MQAKEQTLVQLLEGQKQYVVPLYQRTYSWQRQQLTQLWSDVIRQADILRDGDNAPGHFLGSLVLAPTKAVVGGPQRWLVVDGQQRLTTLTLALCAVRDHVRLESGKQAERIHLQHLINQYLEGGERAKFIPTQDDRAAYYAILEGDPGEAVGNIADAYRLFRELLVAADDPDDPHDIVRIEQALVHRLDLVAITADTDDNVHRIFQSLNNTGMRLTQGDLLRNHYFMLLPTKADEVYDQIWRPMEKRLGVGNLETLGLLDLMLEGITQASRNDTYRLQSERLGTLEPGEDAVVADMRRLAARADALAPVLNPAKAESGSVRTALARLKEWGTEATQVVMLAALERYQQGTATEDQVLRVASYAESFLVRRMLCGRTASGVNRAFADAAAQMLAADEIDTSFREFLSAPRRGWPTDAQLRQEIQSRNFYWSGRQSQRMFVLRSLEDSYSHLEPVDWESASPTIEHVLPQTLTPEWLDGLADPDDQTLPPEQVHEVWVHRLGNLTVTGYNPQLSNSAFHTKRLLYAESHFEMTKAIAQEPTWTPLQIRVRADELTDRAIAIWPAPLDLGPATSDDPWRLVRQLLVGLPEGTWTTYGDVAAVTGRHPVPLGQFLASTSTPNAWRVLSANGKVSPGFRWSDDRAETAQDVLEAEGVRFNSQGSADPDQRLSPADLAELLGIDTGEVPVPPTEEADAALAEGFWAVMSARFSPLVVEGLSRMATAWAQPGGTLLYAVDPQVSGYFGLRIAPLRPWLWGVFPMGKGTIEIPFQYLKIRPPFDDTANREHLRRLIDGLPGVSVDPARIGLRPRIPLSALEDPVVVDGLIAAQNWFITTALSSNDEGPSLDV